MLQSLAGGRVSSQSSLVAVPGRADDVRVNVTLAGGAGAGTRSLTNWACRVTLAGVTVFAVHAPVASRVTDTPPTAGRKLSVVPAGPASDRASAAATGVLTSKALARVETAPPLLTLTARSPVAAAGSIVADTWIIAPL